MKPEHETLADAVRAAIDACRKGVDENFLHNVDSARVIEVGDGYCVEFNGYCDESTRYAKVVYKTRSMDWMEINDDDLDHYVDQEIDKAFDATAL